jgi:hypothetical protein
MQATDSSPTPKNSEIQRHLSHVVDKQKAVWNQRNITGEVINVDKLEQFYNKGVAAVSRRNFLAGAGAVGAASVLAGCGDNSTPAVVATSTAYTDVDYLNFALNLEYLEASFYLYAATGSGLPASSMGTGAGTVSGGAALSTGSPALTTLQQQIVNEIAYNELSHVNFLRGALGSAAVAMPNINIGTSFQTLAAAANTLTPGGGIPAAFSPYTSFNNFLIGAFIFEDVGVTAYAGAAPALTVATNLNYAAGIQAVEAYHAAYIRTSITAISQSTNTTALVTYANSVAALRSSLGGGNETMLTGIGQTIAANGQYTPSSIVAAATSNAVGFSRTTDQVLHIVYGTANGKGVSSGVFFPNGLNGNIKTTAS